MKGQIHSKSDTQNITAKSADDPNEWLAKAQTSGERTATIACSGVLYQ
jgi:hypothetical protein